MRATITTALLLIATSLASPAASAVPLPERRPVPDTSRDIYATSETEAEVAFQHPLMAAPRSATLAGVDPALIVVPPIRRVKPTTPPKPEALRRWLSRL